MFSTANFEDITDNYFIQEKQLLYVKQNSFNSGQEKNNCKKITKKYINFHSKYLTGLNYFTKCFTFFGVYIKSINILDSMLVLAQLVIVLLIKDLVLNQAWQGIPRNMRSSAIYTNNHSQIEGLYRNLEINNSTCLTGICFTQTST